MMDKTTVRPWVAEFEAWKAQRRPCSEGELLREIYRLEQRVNMWREAGLHAKNFILGNLT